MLYNAPLFWSRLAIEADRRDHTGAMTAVNQRGPTRSSRALAITHVAMHDAYFWPHLTSGGRPNPDHPLFFAYSFNNPYDANQRDAAVAGAAFAALMGLYPALSDLFVTGSDLFRPGMEAAFDVGISIGQAVLSYRRNDGSSEASGDVRPNGNRYDHREDPLNLGQGLLHPRWGEVAPFAVTQCHPLDRHPVPDRDSAYDRDYLEVFIKGSRTPPVRPPGHTFQPDRTGNETTVGLYWGYDGAFAIGTPPRLYNQIVHSIISDRAKLPRTRMSESQVVRLLAFVNVAMADAAIAAWFHKYRFQLWRPVVGIRERDPSTGGPYPGQPAKKSLDPLADPLWTPFGAQRTNQSGPEARPFTPNFPSYPSGHATIGTAAFEAVRLFFEVNPNRRDSIGFVLISDELNGRSVDSTSGRRIRHVRRYDSLLDAMYENAVSRVYIGVHWRFDALVGDSPDDILGRGPNIGGVPLGRAIAQDIWNSGLRPAPSGARCSLGTPATSSIEQGELATAALEEKGAE